jgi:hypothetical protein
MSTKSCIRFAVSGTIRFGVGFSLDDVVTSSNRARRMTSSSRPRKPVRSFGGSAFCPKTTVLENAKIANAAPSAVADLDRAGRLQSTARSRFMTESF